jgi:hypothetical protein
MTWLRTASSICCNVQTPSQISSSPIDGMQKGYRRRDKLVNQPTSPFPSVSLLYSYRVRDTPWWIYFGSFSGR